MIRSPMDSMLKLVQEHIPGRKIADPIVLESKRHALERELQRRALACMPRAVSHVSEIDWTLEIMGRLIESHPAFSEDVILKLANDEQWINAAKTILCLYNESFEKLDQFIKASLES